MWAPHDKSNNRAIITLPRRSNAIITALETIIQGERDVLDAIIKRAHFKCRNWRAGSDWIVAFLIIFFRFFFSESKPAIALECAVAVRVQYDLLHPSPREGMLNVVIIDVNWVAIEFYLENFDICHYVRHCAFGGQLDRTALVCVIYRLFDWVTKSPNNVYYLFYRDYICVLWTNLKSIIQTIKRIKSCHLFFKNATRVIKKIRKISQKYNLLYQTINITLKACSRKT